jgi:hypothetical protein
MDSNHNQRKFNWGDPVWVKWPRSPTWPGRIDCIKSDLYKAKQTDPKTGEKVWPVYFYGCKDVAFVKESRLTLAAMDPGGNATDQMKNDPLALAKVSHVEKKFARHVADGWKEAMVEMFANPTIDFQFDITPAGEDQMVNWVHGRAYRYSDRFANSASAWDRFKKKDGKQKALDALSGNTVVKSEVKSEVTKTEPADESGKSSQELEKKALILRFDFYFRVARLAAATGR